MRRTFPSTRRAITLAVISGLSVTALSASAQDNAIEEVVVTGSFLRGSPLDAPSPVQVVDRSSIEAQGAAVIWDVIKNLEVNSGSISNPGSGDNTQVSGSANVNLRNLGENSTLTLINGKRMVPAAVTTRSGGEFVDLNSIPLVMTDRVEILTDGGSALYGADAVAGVVNIIMRNDFEGFELYGDIQGVQKADEKYDATVSAIWGWASDDGDTNLVISAERFERDPVTVRETNAFSDLQDFNGTVSAVGGFFASAAIGAPTPMAWLNMDVMARNASQGGTFAPVWTDPGCYTTFGHDGGPLIEPGARRYNQGQAGGSCADDVSEWAIAAQETVRNSYAGTFEHTFSDNAEFYSFFQHSESTISRGDDGYNESRGPTIFLPQPGAHGGNPVGAYLELGAFAAAAGLTPPTAADMPNHPLAAANGGPNVAAWSQVRNGIIRQGGDGNITETSSSAVQVGLRGEFEAFDRAINYDIGYSWSESSMEENYRTFNRERTELAALGLGGENCSPNGRSDFDFAGAPGAFGFLPNLWASDAAAFSQTFFPAFVFTTRESISLGLTSNNQGQDGCQFYNPFLSSLTNPNVANDPALMDYILEDVRRVDKRNKLAVFDAVVSGELFEMKGGTAQFALGGQYRDRNTKEIANELHYPGLQNRILGYDENGVPNDFHRVSNNYECAMCAFNYNDARTTSAAFMELSLPFIENVETQIALRFEDYGGQIGSELSPKIAMSWRPFEELLVRGSFSQSFRAPNIAIVQTGLQSSSVSFQDPISNQAVRAGLLPPTIENGERESTYTLGGPAPDVGNEYADTYSLGFLWTPGGALEGLSLGADAWRFEVSDRVLPEPPINALQPELDAFLAASQNEANYVLNDSISLDSPVVNVPCSPSAIEAEFGRDSAERLNCVVAPTAYIVPNIQRPVGNEFGDLVTTTLRAINAGEITADGIDLKAGYSWSNDLGMFSANLTYTHVRQYVFDGVPGMINGLLDTGVYDAAGTTGDGNLVRSMPDNKGTLVMSWRNGNQGVTLINRHIGSYRDLGYEGALTVANDFTRPLLSREIGSYNTWDVQYNYNKAWDNSRFGSTTFTVGLLDAFNKTLPYRELSALNYDATVFEGRGQRWYARALWSF
ncbi:TonB-dependent receptor [Gammaproteobacteria bacterium]|nr:TonB-dependent receptor [Gammaproteobacteria bacterium]MDC1422008.1 TonB-dependent receptor [Gammaproteobacteria bacterium]MDC1511071.1 TonB-dependent receptor [Gammaproteobacteria bacterium]